MTRKSKTTDPREANIRSFMRRFKCSRRNAEYVVDDLMPKEKLRRQVDNVSSHSAPGAYTKEV